MTINQTIAAATLTLFLASGAHAQSWQRDDNSQTPTAYGQGTNNIRLVIGCGAFGDPSIAGFSAHIPHHSAFDQVGSVVEGVVEVDGATTYLSFNIEAIGDGVVYDFFHTEEAENAFRLISLVGELERGHHAVFRVPSLGVESQIPLDGSGVALDMIYWGCGMRATGTGILE